MAACRALDMPPWVRIPRFLCASKSAMTLFPRSAPAVCRWSGAGLDLALAAKGDAAIPLTGIDALRLSFVSM